MNFQEEDENIKDDIEKEDWRPLNEIFSTFINLFFSRVNRLLNHLLHKNANNQKQRRLARRSLSISIGAIT